MNLAFLPSPSHNAVHLGPLPLRGYSLMVVLGIVAAVWLGGRRWAARGGDRNEITDIALWAVPFGLIGARVYHVATSSAPYFGTGGDPVKALYVWDGGIGIWGAIAGGALGAWIGCRRRGIPLPAYADAVAPGIALGQAIGRWGNWFNQELFGRPSTLPWALKISPGHDGYVPGETTYHPTFLYESLWCLGTAALVIWAERCFHLDRGRAFALYAAAYTTGRFWIEYLRIDDAHHILGLRLNDWTSLAVFTSALCYLALTSSRSSERDSGSDLRPEYGRG
jgi:prolipoprotein diacylglyceryl transferase